jgi:hypothetical protein
VAQFSAVEACDDLNRSFKINQELALGMPHSTRRPIWAGTA